MAIPVLLFLVQAGCLLWAARLFSVRLQEAAKQNAELQQRLDTLQAEWRQSDRAMYDRLTEAYAAKPPDSPIQPTSVARYEQERVVKLGDPELPLMDGAAAWMRDDEIKEEIEYSQPELADFSIEDLKSHYAATWQDYEKRWQQAHNPLRA